MKLRKIDLPQDETLQDLEGEKEEKLDTTTKRSKNQGLLGQLETFLRSFRTLSFALLLTPVVFIGCLCIAISLVPSIYLFKFTYSFSQSWIEPLHFLALGFSMAFGYYLYGLTLILVVPLVNFLIPFKVKSFKGIWYSARTIPWYIHNALTYIVRYTFLEFITPTPLNILFFRLMGMKIGKGVVINTSHISDPCMITLEDYVTIGGSAHIFAHYGQKGILIISEVKIKKGATIGLKASVMGGVQVGENALIKPHTVLLPKTKVGDGEVI